MPDLPSGAVTFLFTDIEGSTRLWDEHPEAMSEALRHHDDLLRACIEAHDGRVFKTVGDAFCAVFGNPKNALEAVLASQEWLPALALTAEGEPRPLKVRMALHTGIAEERDGDYFGQPLNRVARLLAVGHGGQVLLSLATSEMVRDSLPGGMSLADLGEHRLKDLGRPETVFQLLHPELTADFPPLRSLESMPNNLSQQVTSFVGRGKELTEIKELLTRTRLLTLTGSGGTGKTRLSLQVGADLLDGSGDGVWFVELASLTDPGLVPPTVAGVFGLREEAGKPILQTLTEYLKGKRLLLLLDNCEHLLDACAKLADAVLRQCPQVVILASSREGLGIAGETTYRVPSLSLPDPRKPCTPASLSGFESVRLFVERALQAQTGFTVTDQNAPALASICHRLDGIPLAIELAAARVRSLSVEEINNKLDQRFRLLTGGSRTALPRQQTLRSLIDWSYDLLSDTEKALLCRLSVFSGGWTLEAAEQVCAGEPVEEWEVLEVLTGLADKSLVTPEQREGATRYRLLETVRQYARDRLLESGDGEQWRDRHLACCLSLGEEAEPHLRGAEQQAWLERLETEHDNLRAALDWSSQDPGNAEAGLRLAGAVWRFWYVRGHLGEGRERLAQALEADRADTPAARAKALHGAGGLAWSQGDYAAARELQEESLAIRRELGDRRGIASVLGNLGNVAQCQGDYAAARGLQEESLAIRRELGDRRGMASTLGNLAVVAAVQGDYAAARVLQEESLALFRELGDRGGIATALVNLGTVSQEQGDYAGARGRYEESLVLYRELGDRRGIVQTLEDLATLAAAGGLARRGARLWGAAERLREEIGAPLSPNDLRRQEQQVAAARTALSDDAPFDAAWAEGRALTLEQAMDLATVPPDA